MPQRTPHIYLPPETYGTLSLFTAFPEPAAHLRALTDTVLRRRSSPLTVGEKEVIFAYVSNKNSSPFLRDLHMAIAARHIKGGMNVVRSVVGGQLDDLGGKMGALLRIAHYLTLGAGNLSQNHILSAKRFSATDQEIHDAVLTVSTACMLNRYADGLNTDLPPSSMFYEQMATQVNETGYANDNAR